MHDQAWPISFAAYWRFIVKCGHFFICWVMMNMKEVSWFRLWPYALLAALVVVLDQWSKLWVLDHIVYNWREPVIEGFFDLTHVYNPGAAFSFLAGASGWQKYLFAGCGDAVFGIGYPFGEVWPLGRCGGSDDYRRCHRQCYRPHQLRPCNRFLVVLLE